MFGHFLIMLTQNPIFVQMAREGFCILRNTFSNVISAKPPIADNHEFFYSHKSVPIDGSDLQIKWKKRISFKHDIQPVSTGTVAKESVLIAW